jgi:hypothetical protein
METETASRILCECVCVRESESGRVSEWVCKWVSVHMCVCVGGGGL